jgi:hypothetical protein
MEVFLSQKSPENNYCSFCDYYTCNKKDFNKHLITRKHQKMVNGSIQEVKKIPKNDFSCKNCDKLFKTHSGLWKHNKKCFSNKITIENTNNMIIHLLKENQTLQQMLLEQNKTIIEITKT